MKKITLVLIILLVGCTTTRNISPPPTLIPTALSKEEVASVILFSLRDAPVIREQTVENKTTNRILGMVDRVLDSALGNNRFRQYWRYEGRMGKDTIYAGFHYKNFYMRTEIKYNETEITFKIVDSRNLKQSGDYIHKNALVWLSRLERNVRANLGTYDRVKYEQEMLNKQIKPVP